MFRRDVNFIHKVLLLSAEHDPEGWPAIKMDCENWVESHLHVERHYLKHFPIPDDHMGIEDMVDRLMSLISAPNSAISGKPSEQVISGNPPQQDQP